MYFHEAMRGRVRARAAASTLALVASMLTLATPALADEADEKPEDIVVTGTLIRGVQPTGTQVIGLDSSTVQATGASTTTQILQTVPQFASFNTIQAPVGGGNTITTNRPNLRNLNAGNTNGAASTLMLVDGHRIVGMGVQQTSPDLDTIAPGAIERVEVVPDGGSSIYGADAVGGVINFITRKTFDGVSVDARYGFADNYKTWDANALVGKTWDGGGIYVTYNYSEHDALFGRDRDWVHQFPTQLAGVGIPTTGIECAAPNMRVVGTTNIYGLPLTPSAGAKLNQPNQCDYSDFATIYPQERRHAVFASMTQDLSDSLTFDVKAFFMDRKQETVNGYYRATKTIGPNAAAGQINSPFRSQYIIGSPTEAHTVTFAWGGDDAITQDVHLRAWGVTPQFTLRMGENWRARVMLNYGESEIEAHAPLLNDTVLNNAIRAGLFNPYNPGASDPAALDALTRWETFGHVRQSQMQTRAIIDGDLFQLPGGAVKLAAGVEYMHETFYTQKSGGIVPGTENSGFGGLTIGGTPIIPAGLRAPIFKPSRNVKSAFGELVVPILKDTAFFQELALSASGRYDKYSDFGDTFNPKIGLTWKPFDQLRLRGQWGKSFAAPSLANSADADPSTATWSTGFVFGIFVPASALPTLAGLGYPAPTAANSNILTLGGGSNQLKPQTAQTWSLGADLEPIPGLRLSGTYWNVKWKNLIASPVGTAAGNPALYFQQFLSSYKINPTQADIDALLGQASAVNGAPCAPQPQCLYVLEINTTQNLGRFNQSGVDFSASYGTATNFGAIDFNLGGTYLLKREQSVSATAPMIDQFPFGFSRLSLRSSLGVEVGNLRGQVTWNHLHGYDFGPATPALASFYPAQDHVGSFNTIDLFFKYDFAGDGAMKDLSLTLGVNNVFDQDPPVKYVGGSQPSQYGYANGSTIGRLVQFGFSKKF